MSSHNNELIVMLWGQFCGISFDQNLRFLHRYLCPGDISVIFRVYMSIKRKKNNDDDECIFNFTRRERYIRLGRVENRLIASMTVPTARNESLGHLFSRKQ